MHNDLSYVSTSSGLSSLDKNSDVHFQDHNLPISAESSSLSNIQPSKLQLKYSQVSAHAENNDLSSVNGSNIKPDIQKELEIWFRNAIVSHKDKKIFTRNVAKISL